MLWQKGKVRSQQTVLRIQRHGKRIQYRHQHEKAYQDEKYIYCYKYQHMFRLFTHLLSSFLPFVTRENTNSIPKIRMEMAELYP